MAMVKNDILDLAWGKVPMLKVLLLYVIGILLSVFSDAYLSPMYAIAIIGVMLFAYLSLSFYLRKTKQNFLFTLSFSLILIMYGYYKYAYLQEKYIINDHGKVPASQYLGIVDDEPIVKEKTIRFPVRILQAIDSAETVVVEGKIMLTILRDSIHEVSYLYGDKIVFLNKLKPLNPPYNPKEFDYRNYLLNKGISEQCFLQSEELAILGHDFGNPIITYSLNIRSKLIEKFRKYISDDEAFNVAVALIFGYRSQIDQETISAFTNTGTIHVLSVSGLHVSLVFALLNMMLFWMNSFRYGSLIKSIIILIAIWGYVILTGMSPPILRAGIMISFFVSSLLINRKQIPLNTLAASAFFILLFAPNYFFDVGFQLSYLAILGIILLYPILKKYYLSSNKWVNYVLEYTYVSISAQLFTLPLTLYYFGQFPNYFLLANLFIAIPSTLIMYVGIGLAISPIDFTNNIFGNVTAWLLNFMMQGLKWMEHLPFAVVNGIDWHWSQVVILLVAILALVIALNVKSAKSFLLFLTSLLVLTMFNSFQYIQKSSYSALKFYNIRTEVAISAVKNNNVVLLSTLDSLRHSTLQYSVLPDLRQYASDTKVKFQVIANEEKRNRIIELNGTKILILESKVKELPNAVDFILWRKNNYSDIGLLQELSPNAIFIIDGSNNDKTIERMQRAFESNPERLYILKNNFAYVWDEEY